MNVLGLRVAYSGGRMAAWEWARACGKLRFWENYFWSNKHWFLRWPAQGFHFPLFFCLICPPRGDPALLLLQLICIVRMHKFLHFFLLCCGCVFMSVYVCINTLSKIYYRKPLLNVKSNWIWKGLCVHSGMVWVLWSAWVSVMLIPCSFCEP